MTLAFIDIGSTELILIGIVGLFLVIAVGNYGRDTALGYWGSILLAFVTSPLVAFLILLLVKKESNYSGLVWLKILIQ